ncbi:hypothetical protein PG987_005975 [Apiospora arundinis]
MARAGGIPQFGQGGGVPQVGQGGISQNNNGAVQNGQAGGGCGSERAGWGHSKRPARRCGPGGTTGLPRTMAEQLRADREGGFAQNNGAAQGGQAGGVAQSGNNVAGQNKN